MCITGAMKTCPTTALEVILDLTPLYIVVERVSNKTLYQPIICQKVGSSLVGQSSLFSVLKDEAVKRYTFEKSFLTKLSNQRERMGRRTIHQLPKGNYP